MTADDIRYYRRRVHEEDARAADDADPVAAQAHAELAALYRQLLDRDGVPLED